MEMGSDGEEDHQIRSSVGDGGNKKKKMKMRIGDSKDALSKPKRQMKTPFQLETLEKVYAGSNLI